MNELIRSVFLSAFGCSSGGVQNDAAVLEIPLGRLAMTTDSFVVQPLEFPGGSIGSLAVHGTVNDLAMSGAEPLYLTAGFILEEGLPLEVLARVAQDMAAAARAAGVRIVTGDTKVVERGKGDGSYINTAGVGIVRHGLEISPSSVRPGDSVLLSGDLGRHGMTIMSLRAGLSFGDGLESDSAPLHESVAAVIRAGIPVHCLRDVTRGGLTATLSEIAESAGLTVKLNEMSIPVREDVRSACGLLGLDPLQVACEGRYLAVLPREHEEEALNLMRGCGVSAGACVIGRVEELGTERLCALPGESAAGLVWGTGCWEMVQEGVSLPVPASGNAFNAALACAWSWEAAFSSHSRAVSRFFSTPNPYRQMIPMLYCSEA